MKLALFEKDGEVLPGVLTERGIVGIAESAQLAATPQATMQGIIDDFERLRPALERLAQRAQVAHARSSTCGCARRCRGRARSWRASPTTGSTARSRPAPLNMFLKNPDAVIGPGDTIVLPEFTEPWIFMHEAELALVIKGPAKMVTAARTGGAPSSATPA